MTENEKDAIAGRVRREYSQAKRDLAALRVKARALGELLSQLGKQLLESPESIMFLGQAHDTRFHAGGPRVFEDQHFVDMTPAMLRQMIEEIRQAIIRQERLRNEITQLEGADPER